MIMKFCLQSHRMRHSDLMRFQIEPRQAKSDLLRLPVCKNISVPIAKPVIFVQYRQSGYRKKFLAAHESDILLHKAAKQEFDKLGMDQFPSMDALKTEYTTLSSQKNKFYAEYKQARQEMVDLQMAKHNIDRVLNVQQPAKTIKSMSHDEC